MHTHSPRLLNMKQLSVLLGVPERQVGALYRRGLFPGIRLSHKYLRFDGAEVLAALKQHRRQNYDRCA